MNSDSGKVFVKRDVCGCRMDVKKLRGMWEDEIYLLGCTAHVGLLSGYFWAGGRLGDSPSSLNTQPFSPPKMKIFFSFGR